MRYIFGICAIASPLEENYLPEWIDYHKKIGVSRFYIATNDWTWEQRDPAVLVGRIDGRAKQLPYYTWFTRQKTDVDFCAFIDCDEFIHLGKYASVNDLAERHEADDAFCLNWRLFGSSGLHFNGDYSVLRRFTHRQEGFNKHIKTVLNLRKLRSFGENKLVTWTNPHFATILPQQRMWPQQDIISRSDDGRIVQGPFDTWAQNELDDDSPWLAHFFCKTPEEWKRKRERGRIDVPPNSPLLHWEDKEFAERDLNDVEDTSLRDV